MASLATYDSYAGYYAQLINDQTPPDSAFVREFYRVLFAYYQQNGLYTYVNEQLRATKTTDHALKPIRNPAWRVVEFYASKLWPGTLPDALTIKADNDTLESAIHTVWDWSNFSSVKQRWARWFAIYGDLFVKIATKVDEAGDPKSVYMGVIRPQHVTDFTLDERGFLTWIRIDVPIFDDEGEEEAVYTEIWSKAEQQLRIWSKREGTVDDEEEEMPTPDTMASFEDLHGEDFIPIVYQPFRDDGAGRGGGAYAAQLDKIDEVNRQATRLAQILFRYNRPLWAATTQSEDVSGRPLPPVDLSGIKDADGFFTVGDDEILALPAMADMKPMVPDINYADALAVLQDQMSELVRDLPELAYYDLRDVNEISGRAVRFLLDDMISRVEEARGNAEAALVRAHQIAITVGQNVGLIEESVGTFEEGELDHQFEERPILPEDRTELATLIQTFTSAGASLFAAARAAGMPEDEARALSEVDLFGLEGSPRGRAGGTTVAPSDAGAEGESVPDEEV